MTHDRTGIFMHDDPFSLARAWLCEAEKVEINDPDAIALATVGPDGLPNVRMVLLREIEADAFVFYTNYGSVKAREIAASGSAAFVLHWKSLRRQIRVRGHVTREDGPKADAYYAARSLRSRIGAWASRQSTVLESRQTLMEKVTTMEQRHGSTPPRPPFWGGFRITPVEMEFWADGAFRLHDRFRWTRAPKGADAPWHITRLNP